VSFPRKYFEATTFVAVADQLRHFDASLLEDVAALARDHRVA